jgi:hypothetical protein
MTNKTRTENAVLTILVILSAVSIKTAFMHNAGLMVVWMGVIASALIIYMNKKNNHGNKGKEHSGIGE